MPQECSHRCTFTYPSVGCLPRRAQRQPTRKVQWPDYMFPLAVAPAQDESDFGSPWQVDMRWQYWGQSYGGVRRPELADIGSIYLGLGQFQ